MADHPAIIDDTKDLPPQERAAAIAHWVYVKTSENDSEWNMRVQDAWDKLDPAAREFNLRSIETWAFEDGVLEVWIEAIKSYRAEA